MDEQAKIAAWVERVDRLHWEQARHPLARAAQALAPLRSPHPRIDATAAAASAYLSEPSDARWSEFFRCASMSYPFGPGEGCHSMQSGECGLGSGCRSGAGFVWSVAQTCGFAEVWRLLHEIPLPKD